MAASLHDILDLEQLEERAFVGKTRPTDLTRSFGGEVAGQALVAAGRTVPDGRRVHSLHSYFLRPGDPRHPIRYEVDPIRDGRSFTTRRVVAVQRGEPIFHLSASFHREEQGLAHQVPRLDAPSPESLPGPDEAPPDGDVSRRWYDALRERFSVEVRIAHDTSRAALDRQEEPPLPRQRVWIRAAQPLPDDPLLHVCAATYASDLFLLSAALPPHRIAIEDGTVQMASLDHAVWFHAPFRADEWLFYDTEGTWAGGSRALCRGSLFDRGGTLVASVVQEGLVRLRAR